MRDSNGEKSCDFYSQIISRASRNISYFADEFQTQNSNQSYNNFLISDRKRDMLNILESTMHNEDIQLNEISKFRDWLDSLDRDQQLFDDISTGTNFPIDSPYADIDRLIKEDRKRRENQNNSHKNSKKNSFEKVIEKEKENLRKAAYTQSVISMSKDLLMLQKEIQEVMKPENILKNESESSVRFENIKKKLEIELKNRQETEKLLKKDLKEATKLFNSNVEYHKKLEEDITKLESFLLIFQSKSSIEIIEKAKKSNFIEIQWKLNQKELISKIKEIELELNKYQNSEQTRFELKNLIYGNNLELEKTKKNYDELIASINQDMNLSDYYQTSSLQILEKELINSLNFHRGFESKNTQSQIKMATTSFTRLFMKFSKSKQTSFNKFDKVLRKNNVTFEMIIDGLNEFNLENKEILNESMNQLLDELKNIIKNYGQVFIEKFEYNDKRMKLNAKNQLDVLNGRKQRLSSQILNRETDIALNSSTYKTIEGVYYDILQTFSMNDDEKYIEIKNEIQSIDNFIKNASSILKELDKKMKDDLNAQKKSPLKRSSSAIISPVKLKINQKEKIESDLIVQPPVVIEDDKFTIEEPVQISEEKIEMKPLLPPKSEQKSPRFSPPIEPSEVNKIEMKPENQSPPTKEENKSRIQIASPSYLPPSPRAHTPIKQKRQHIEIRNLVKDNSPHFSERKKREPRREKSRAEIEEERRISIMKSHEPSKRTIQDIPKIPFIKNVDPKIIDEIDSTYSFSSDSKSKNKAFKKEVKKKIQNNEVNVNRKSCNDDDEFRCIKNNINISKKNISELPFSKRKVTVKHDNSMVYPHTVKNNDISEVPFFKNLSKNSIQKSATVNILPNVFNFSEMTLEKNINQKEVFYCRSDEKMIVKDNDHSIDQKRKMLRASLDLKNRRNDNLFAVKNSKNAKDSNKNKFNKLFIV